MLLKLHTHQVVAWAVAWVAALAGAASATAPVSGPRTIPTVYEAGHFYAVPETRSGGKLRLLVDTGGGGGGGMYWITGAAARRLGLKPRTCKVDDASLQVAPVPRFKSGRGLPPPLADRASCGEAVLVQGEHYTEGDGQLGAGYLPGRVWTFDYPGRRLTVQGASWRPGPDAHAARLGFERDAKGRIATGFARITIHVDGQPIDMLLDTGATAHPTAAGEKASGTPTVRGEGVASYIVQSVFDRWHRDHPDWRVVRDGDDLFGPGRAMPIIEVPKVRIAGWSVGPVWFTVRPDRNFHVFMAQWMDKAPDGAVGGNVFRHFVMSIDYPRATAYFRCVSGCTASGNHD